MVNGLWLKLKFRDAISDELIDAELELYYQIQGSEEWTTEKIGTTNDGTFYLEKKFPEKVLEVFLFAYGTDNYHSEGTYQSSNHIVPEYLSNTKLNEKVIYLDPIYRMELSFENVNCYDATDSLRVYVSNPDTNSQSSDFDTLVGCYNGAPAGIPTWSHKPYVNYIGYLKRNGVTSEVDTKPTLEPFMINQVLIEY